MADFVPLLPAVEPWLDTPLDALPADIRDRVTGDLSPLPWDLLSPDQRKKAVLQWDAMHDPQGEYARDLSWELVVRKYQLEAEIAEWQQISPSAGPDMVQKGAHLAKLQRELARTDSLLEHALLVSPAHAPNPAASPDSNPPARYLPFPIAMDRLHARLGAIPDELAGWIFMGPEDGGIAAYRNANELDPPTRFFFDISLGDDYLAPLMGCWFAEKDIEGFEPQDRFITGAALIERWGQQANIQTESFIRAKVAESRLVDIHPIRGGTQAGDPEEDWLPPISGGLFWLAHVEAVEEEDFGRVLSVKREGETPEQRARRIGDRRDQLRAQGVRGFLQAVADEEGLSVPRIKQILKPASGKKKARSAAGRGGRPTGWGG